MNYYRKHNMKFRYIYATTFKVYLGNEWCDTLHYIGKHTTDNLNDGYNGSGVLISKFKEQLKANPHIPIRVDTNILTMVCDSDDIDEIEKTHIINAFNNYEHECVLNIKHRPKHANGPIDCIIKHYNRLVDEKEEYDMILKMEKCPKYRDLIKRVASRYDDYVAMANWSLT